MARQRRTQAVLGGPTALSRWQYCRAPRLATEGRRAQPLMATSFHSCHAIPSPAPSRAGRLPVRPHLPSCHVIRLHGFVSITTSTFVTTWRELPSIAQPIAAIEVTFTIPPETLTRPIRQSHALEHAETCAWQRARIERMLTRPKHYLEQVQGQSLQQPWLPSRIWE